MPLGVVSDMGAEDDSYMPLHLFNVLDVSSSKSLPLRLHCRDGLKAANPSYSHVPLMNVVGSRILRLVFHPEVRIRNTSLRAVQDLLYGCILRAAFFRVDRGLFSLAKNKGFKPSPDAP